MGFERVYDYLPGKVAWFAAGLPSEGTNGDAARAGALARPVETCGIDATIGDVVDRFDGPGSVVIVTHDDVVVGLLRAEVGGLPAATPVTDAMQPGPPTVRPSIQGAELAESMAGDHQDRVLVTTYTGKLLGLIHKDDLHGQR